MEIQSKRLIHNGSRVVETEPVLEGEAVIIDDAPVVETRRYAAPAPVAVISSPGVVDRVASLIWLSAALVSGVIVLRFLLLMFGANMATPFASAVSGLSQPLVQPFLGLFGSNVPYGVGAIEYTDLIAVAFYCLCAAVVVRILDVLLGPWNPFAGRRTTL